MSYKVTPELLSSITEQITEAIGCGDLECHIAPADLQTLVDEIQHQWAGGWTRITDDASLPEVGRRVDLRYRKAGCDMWGVMEAERADGEAVGRYWWNVGYHWRYATPMPGEPS